VAEPPRERAGAELTRLLAVDMATIFVTNGAGRIVRLNDPDRSLGPRLCLAGCLEGNLVRVRHDVSDRIAQGLLALVQAELPWFDPDVEPRCLRDLLDLLSAGASAPIVTTSVLYRLPQGLAHDAGARMVCGDTAEGEALLSRLAEHGMPQTLLDAGFLGVGDFWPPWCVALVGEEIASLAFAARLGERGAEVGVYSFPGFRGRGLAAAVTARWSSLEALAGRELFYSTQTTNRSSQRVAERLGLVRIGARLSVD
jgi:GNAT superfamily N-acetyltransferase